jgi:hypothetical protein
MHLPGELARPRTLKSIAYRAQWELRIESAFRIEAHLARENGAVMKSPSRHQGGGIEPGRPPPETKRIVRVA